MNSISSYVTMGEVDPSASATTTATAPTIGSKIGGFFTTLFPVVTGYLGQKEAAAQALKAAAAQQRLLVAQAEADRAAAERARAAGTGGFQINKPLLYVGAGLGALALIMSLKKKGRTTGKRKRR